MINIYYEGKGKVLGLAYNTGDKRLLGRHTSMMDDVHGTIDCDKKNIYTIVAVTPGPVRVPTQRPLVPSFMSVVG